MQILLNKYLQFLYEPGIVLGSEHNRIKQMGKNTVIMLPFSCFLKVKTQVVPLPWTPDSYLTAGLTSPIVYIISKYKLASPKKDLDISLPHLCNLFHLKSLPISVKNNSIHSVAQDKNSWIIIVISSQFLLPIY